MSWSLFKTKCSVLTGQQHVSVQQFAQTIASAYHECISLHFESMTAGGKFINSAPKYPILYQQILAQCNANLASQSEVHILNQIGPFIQQYFIGLQILGPTGTVVITSPGVYTGIPVVQNLNFNILLESAILCFRTHLMTLTGIYTSTTIPGLVVPTWSGALLIALP